MNTTVKFSTKETHYYMPDFEWHPIPPAQVPQPTPDLFPTQLPAAGPDPLCHHVNYVFWRSNCRDLFDSLESYISDQLEVEIGDPLGRN